MLVTLASATDRVVALEGLLQAQHQRGLEAAIDQLSAEQALTVLMIEFLLRDEPGGAVMTKVDCAHWLRRGLPPGGLPRRLRPLLEEAQHLARQFMSSVGKEGVEAELPPILVDFACWLHSGCGRDDQHQWDD
jgi:hypothetical protein